jgi:hypothetical protein
MADSAEERARLRQEIDSLTQETSRPLTAYQPAIYEREDKLLFDQLT